MATATATASNVDLQSTWTVSGGVITSGPSIASASRVFAVSGVPDGAEITGATLGVTVSSTIFPPRRLRINGVDVERNGSRTVTITPTASGNGEYTVNFEFQSGGNASSDGQYMDRVDFTGMLLTVTYSQEEPGPEPEPEPEYSWNGARPISVFALDADNYDNNGLAILFPLDGTLTAIAGGNNDISMRYPITPDGKWRYLIPGAIVRVPVPPETIENAFAGIEVDLYRTNQSAALREAASEPQTINYPTFSATAAYNNEYQVGSKVTFENRNYQCIAWDNENPLRVGNPDIVTNYWKVIARQTGGSPVLVQLPSGSDLYYLEDAGSGWYKMSTPMGIEGYIKSSQVTYIRHMTPEESQERTILDQLYRIQSATVDCMNNEVSVYAQHVSYDLAAILIRDVKCSQTPPSLAINRMMDGLMTPYRGQIATNLTTDENGTYTGAVNGKNGIFAFLDPDSGIVPTFQARFTRDNWDLFILKKTGRDRGIRIAYGKNARGITWKRDRTGLVTRVVPVAKAADGTDLYLPELYVDSPLINSYPLPYMERLAVKGQVGKDDGTGTDTTWTEATLFDEMRVKAQERYTMDHADVLYQEVTVDFEQLGDTDEFAWLKDLEQVNLYDIVHAEDDRVGLDIALEVTELEWDFVRRKITGLKLSTAIDHGLSTVAGYNIRNNSIGSEKLTEAAITEIANLLT